MALTLFKFYISQSKTFQNQRETLVSVYKFSSNCKGYIRYKKENKIIYIYIYIYIYLFRNQIISAEFMEKFVWGSRR